MKLKFGQYFAADVFKVTKLNLDQYSEATECLKKTEFCQIEHLQILLVIGEKYLMKFVANSVVSCFESAISMLLLGPL